MSRYQVFTHDITVHVKLSKTVTEVTLATHHLHHISSHITSFLACFMRQMLHFPCTVASIDLFWLYKPPPTPKNPPKTKQKKKKVVFYLVIVTGKWKTGICCTSIHTEAQSLRLCWLVVFVPNRERDDVVSLKKWMKAEGKWESVGIFLSFRDAHELKHHI